MTYNVDNHDPCFDETGVLIDMSKSIFDYAHGRRPINFYRMSKRQRKLYEKAENRYWRNQNKNG